MRRAKQTSALESRWLWNSANRHATTQWPAASGNIRLFFRLCFPQGLRATLTTKELPLFLQLCLQTNLLSLAIRRNQYRTVLIFVAVKLQCLPPPPLPNDAHKKEYAGWREDLWRLGSVHPSSQNKYWKVITNTYPKSWFLWCFFVLNWNGRKSLERSLTTRKRYQVPLDFSCKSHYFRFCYLCWYSY